MKNISLTEKLVLYFLIIGIGVISIISIYSFYSTKSALMSRTFDQLTSLRLVKKSQVEVFFSDRIRDILLLANADDTREIFSFINEKRIMENDAELLEKSTAYIRKYKAMGNYFNCICLSGRDRVLVKGFPPRRPISCDSKGRLSPEANCFSCSLPGQASAVYSQRYQTRSKDRQAGSFHCSASHCRRQVGDRLAIS